ncbi:unnamed protein product [Citrullus colocynthis]|uniref:Uncharacterized protein n=1 Tax=Citrullus colocynthis TaxID=252529 RepID=A0ABP0Y4Y3_9ROSI
MLFFEILEDFDGGDFPAFGCNLEDQQYLAFIIFLKNIIYSLFESVLLFLILNKTKHVLFSIYLSILIKWHTGRERFELVVDTSIILLIELSIQYWNALLPLLVHQIPSGNV